MDRLVHVACILGRGQYPRQILSGLARFARLGHPWVLDVVNKPDVPGSEWLKRGRPDAVVGQINSPEFAKALRWFRRPVVNVSAVLADVRLPTVCTDNAGVGRLAAEYLLGLGLRHFAYAGDAFHYSRLREEGFRQFLREQGLECLAFPVSSAPKPHDISGYTDFDPAVVRRATEWLLALPKPVGILTVDDQRAVALTALCQQCGLDVPRQVAVLGIENTPEVCETGWPPVSSVDLGAERVGLEAGRLLNELLQGRRPPAQPILVAPAKVDVRGSTDLLNVGDEHVAQALRYIQNHSGRPLRVADLVRQVLVSRRLLERRFKQALGRTILDYIQQVRVERCGQLLRETHYSLAEVGRLAGFASTAQMRAVFRSRLKQSPGQYRRRHGLMIG